MTAIHGEGSSTGKLIEVTERLVKDAKVLYQNIWVVFDKDDFIYKIRNPRADEYSLPVDFLCKW